MRDDLFKLAGKLVMLASSANITVSFAESCTGGLIGSSVTDIAGASKIFLGSAVTYSNKSKHDILGVESDVLEQSGAVSAECAAQMASGAKKIYGSDIALSVTGIAGPDGGTQDKPVGTVWFGYASAEKGSAFVRHFDGTRSDIRFAAACEALRLIIAELS